MSTFCTSIHCMDGRLQEPIISYLKGHYNVKYVDSITEAGPCKILAENTNKVLVDSIIARVEISISKHKSGLIAVSGHHDCAGNPCEEEAQKDQIRRSVKYCKEKYRDIKIIGLWVDSEWKIYNI